MNVEMPDGTIIEGVPEGTTKAQILARYNKKSKPTDGMSGLETSLAGTGKFFRDIYGGARQFSGAVGNTLGLIDNDKFDSIMNEEKERKRLDAPLMDTFGGKVGYVTGAVAPSLGLMTGSVPAAAAYGAAQEGLMPADTMAERGTNATIGMVTGAAGQKLANWVGKFFGPKAPASVLSAEQRSAVQKALDLGYELTPDQITGKNWQKNLTAALAQMPSTGSRQQAMAARNAANTEKLVTQAQDMVGGVIDQPSAAAAAVEGFDAGLKAEAKRLDKGYADVLDGVSVQMNDARPALDALRSRQNSLPESSRSGPANKALNDLLGDPNYEGKLGDYTRRANVSPAYSSASRKQVPKDSGYINERPTIPGGTAQALRSDYTMASATETRGRDRMLYADMRDAIDGAIEAALPAAKRGQFAAVNERYGLYAGLEAMTPKQQNTFLSRLYRGSDSPDQFYSFLGMAPEGEFKQVARGFVSKLVEDATEGGKVSARKLGLVTEKANPDAMRFFGGAAADLMRDIGTVGKNVLPEIGNSQTANRALYQGLLQGGGLLGGGLAGSSVGDTPGAIAGTALGMFALPKAAQTVYLSKAMRELSKKSLKGSKGNPQLAEMAKLLRQYGSAFGPAALALDAD